MSDQKNDEMTKSVEALEEKNLGGRPTKWDDSMIERGFRLALLGLKDVDIAMGLGITTSTYYDWLEKRKRFSEAIRKGKIDADVAVAASLYKRATGFEIPEEKLFQFEGLVIRADTKKYYPPDTKAAEIWLRNRRPKEWRNVQNHEIAGKDGGPIQTTYIDPSKISDQALEEIMAALPEGASTSDKADEHSD
jgi:hypothetical protein